MTKYRDNQRQFDAAFRAVFPNHVPGCAADFGFGGLDRADVLAAVAHTVGLKPTNAKMYRFVIALHEAAHAVTAWRLGLGDLVIDIRVTRNLNSSTGGHVRFVAPWQARRLGYDMSAEATATFGLAGHIATLKLYHEGFELPVPESRDEDASSDWMNLPGKDPAWSRTSEPNAFIVSRFRDAMTIVSENFGTMLEVAHLLYGNKKAVTSGDAFREFMEVLAA